jgi:hypothetical protein
VNNSGSSGRWPEILRSAQTHLIPMPGRSMALEDSKLK